MMEILKNYFPIVEEISDVRLRQAVLETFAEGLRRGGWEPEDMKKMPGTLLIPDCPFSFWEHTNAVTDCAVAIAREMKRVYGGRFAVDFDILIAGGLLHDVGKLLEIERSTEGAFRKSRSGRRLRHPMSGAALAAEKGVPEDVLHIIACHSKEGEGMKLTTEAIIIHHADFCNFDPFKP